MIEHAHIDQGQGITQAQGDGTVGSAWFTDSRWMVVRQDHGGRIVRQAVTHHFARMHAGAIYGAAEQLFERNDAVAIVEKQAGKDLVRIGGQARLDVAGAGHGVGQARYFLQFAVQVAATQFECGLKPAPGHRTQACALLRGMQQAFQSAVAGEQIAAHIDRACAASPRADEHGQQFGVGQAAAAALVQLFAGAFSIRPVSDAHVLVGKVGETTLAIDMPWRQRMGSRNWVSLRLSSAQEISYMGDVRLDGMRVLLGVGGGIAAYKSADLVRRLRDAGAEVRVVMTENATRFVAPLTFQALSGHPVRSSLWDESAEAAMGHIELARWADQILIAPASADLLAQLAQGRAEDLLATLVLATAAPVSVAPAMNQQMWAHPATQANLEVLRNRGVRILGPGSGSQACGEVGEGRMLEPAELVVLMAPARGSQSLAGLRVLVSAGPTFEDIDPVRFIGNRSSGRMGFAIAAAAQEAGARVRLVAGPVGLATPAGVERMDVRSARQMREAVVKSAASNDIFISAAAVGDYRPQDCAPHKIKKTGKPLALELIQNPDILAEVSAMADRPFLVGFAAETEDLERHARDKLVRKGLDLIAANRVGESLGFESRENALLLLWEGGQEELARADKTTLARSLIERVASRYQAQARNPKSA